MKTGIDILENDLVIHYPDVLEELLKDRTTDKNIFWATKNYEHLGDAYSFNSPILLELITGKNGEIIMPRVRKDLQLQKSRSRDMAEVFTPAWLCNVQNNLVDKKWFGKEGVFNHEIINDDGVRTWKVNNSVVRFPKGRTWKDYVAELRMEISCGEAPYIASRYDSTTGEFIQVGDRVGILDRKLRVINENVNSIKNWTHAVERAYQSTYAYEWQGDSLLLARESMLATVIENFKSKFIEEPSLSLIHRIANIISWNVWQMDGLKGVIPKSCMEKTELSINLFGEKEVLHHGCQGCKKEEIKRHNGTYCNIREWRTDGKQTDKNIRFIDIINP